MSWGDIFFAFSGRMDRKAYWTASVAIAAAGLAFAALLTDLATGHPFSRNVWMRSADSFSIWFPVWVAYFGLIAWPASAIAIKRLHDRNRPAWIWYGYFALSMIASLIPARENPQAELSQASEFALTVYFFASAYIFVELGILRGTAGVNRFGVDPLPLEYNGGASSLWSLMLAPEGRISRSKWWFGFALVFTAWLFASVWIGYAAAATMKAYPDFADKLKDAGWLASDEGQTIMTQFAASIAIPSLLMVLVCWCLFMLGIKRLHDRGLSGWLMLVVVLPFLGVLFAPAIAENPDDGMSFERLTLLLLAASTIWGLLQFGILKGDVGPNSHGPDPLS